MQCFKRPQPILAGIDISANEIRLVQLRQIKQKFHVERADIIPLPARTIVDGKIVSPQALETQLRLVSEQLKNSPIAVAIPMQHIITKRATLPKQRQQKYARAIANHLTQYFPTMTQELCYDYSVIPTSNKVNDELFIVATRYEYLMEYVSVFERNGLVVRIVDVDFYALVRAVKYALPAAWCSSSNMILDVENTTARFIVLQQDEIIYHQQIDLPCINDLYHKFNTAMQLCMSTCQVQTLNTLFLTGNPVVIFAIADELAMQFKLHTYRVNPFKNILGKLSSAAQEHAARLAMCCGLAMRAIPQW